MNDNPNLSMIFDWNNASAAERAGFVALAIVVAGLLLTFATFVLGAAGYLVAAAGGFFVGRWWEKNAGSTR